MQKLGGASQSGSKRGGKRVITLLLDGVIPPNLLVVFSKNYKILTSLSNKSSIGNVG
jgi:hypothetical protein